MEKIIQRHQSWNANPRIFFFIWKLLMILGMSYLTINSNVFANNEHQHDEALNISTSLSLHEVVEQTWQRNPQQHVIEARLKHTDAELKRASSLWFDDVSLTVNHYNDALMNSDGLHEWEVGMELPLWLPGQKQANQETVAKRRSVVNASEPVLKLQIAAIVRELLWHIALTKNQVLIREKEWDVVKKLQADIYKRVELGDLAKSDLVLAEQASLAGEAALRLAEQEYKHAIHRYRMVTDLEALPSSFEEIATDDLLLTVAHPLLNQAEHEVSASKSYRDQVEIEKRGNPSLFIGTRHERGSSNDKFANAIGLSLNIPLGLSAHTEHKVTAAGVDLSEKQSHRVLLFRELSIAIQDASNELAAIRQQYQFAEQQHVLAKKNLDFSKKAFSLGESSLIEFLRIQAKAFAVERQLYQKKLEVGLHIARLNQAKGIIP